MVRTPRYKYKQIEEELVEDAYVEGFMRGWVYGRKLFYMQWVSVFFLTTFVSACLYLVTEEGPSRYIFQGLFYMSITFFVCSLVSYMRKASARE